MASRSAGGRSVLHRPSPAATTACLRNVPPVSSHSCRAPCGRLPRLPDRAAATRPRVPAHRASATPRRASGSLARRLLVFAPYREGGEPLVRKIEHEMLTHAMTPSPSADTGRRCSRDREEPRPRSERPRGRRVRRQRVLRFSRSTPEVFLPNNAPAAFPRASLGAEKPYSPRKKNNSLRARPVIPRGRGECMLRSGPVKPRGAHSPSAKSRRHKCSPRVGTITVSAPTAG